MSKCVSSDDLPKSRLFYFGPSNPIGPGSVWAPKPTGGYGLRFSLDKPLPSEGDRAKLIKRGPAATCTGTSNVKWSFKPSLTFDAPGSAIQADLGLAFDKAEKVIVSVESWRVDRLQEFDYETWAKSAGAGGYGNDLLGTNWQSRSFMDAAVVITGFSAELTFQGNIAAELKAKYPNPTLNLGTTFTGSWQGDRTLKLTSTNEFYVAGSLTKVKAPGSLGMFGTKGQKGRLVHNPVTIPKGAEASLDEFHPPE